MFLQSDVAEGSGGLSRDSKTIKYPVVGPALALAVIRVFMEISMELGQRERRPYNRIFNRLGIPR